MDFKVPSSAPGNDGCTTWTVIQKYATSANASSTALAITNTPTSGSAPVLDDLLISVDTKMNAIIRSHTTQTTIAKMYLASDSPVQITFRNGLKSPDDNEVVEILTSTSGNICVTSSYHCV